MIGEILATLPDGSVATRDRIDWCGSIVSRWVGDACVWGQSFSRTEDHDGQVADVVAKMAADPSSFVRWWNLPVVPVGQLSLEVDAA